MVPGSSPDTCKPSNEIVNHVEGGDRVTLAYYESSPEMYSCISGPSRWTVIRGVAISCITCSGGVFSKIGMKSRS
jgi:hypothetical protein